MRIEKPARVSHSRRQAINGTPEEVFSLCCPVREAEWVEGWDPSVVHTDTGVAERDCVFVTENGGVESTWLVTVHDAGARRIAMVKCTPGEVMTRIEIGIEPAAGGSAVDIRYTHTACGPAGVELVRGFTEEHWEGFMREWESEMNRFVGACGLALLLASLVACEQQDQPACPSTQRPW